MDFSPMMLFILLLGLIILVSKGFYILREYERGVIFRFGRLAKGLVGKNGPGVVIIIPFIDKLVRVSLRTVTMDVPPQDVITKDNVSVKVNAVIYFRVVESEKAIVGVEELLLRHLHDRADDPAERPGPKPVGRPALQTG